MLKVGESMASCDQDFKSTKVINVKSRNGYASMPAPVQGLHSTDQDNTSLNNITNVKEVGNDKGDIINGTTVDRSVYEYCCQLINPPCGVDSSNTKEAPEANDETSETPEPIHLTAIADSTSNNNLDIRKPGQIVRKKKSRDLPGLIPIVSEKNIDKINSIPKQDCSYNLVAEPETCPDNLSLDANSHFLEAQTNLVLDCTTKNSLPQPDFVKPNIDSEVKELENNVFKGNTIGATGSSDVELKNCRGQKARKSLIAQINFKDLGSEIDGKSLENSKSVSASSLSDKEGIKSSQASNQAELNAGALTGMTIKVNVLENALGLSTQSFSQLDAKTFDRIVLSVFQHKGIGQARKSGIGARASAKFGSTSRHANRRIGSAFMADHVQSSKNPMMQQQLETINSPNSSNSSEAFAKRPGFLAKKTSAPTHTKSFRNFEGFASASESMDSDSRSSLTSFIQDSSSKSSFVQKARKSQTPWSCNSSLRGIGKGDGSDVLSDVNSQFNISEDPSFHTDKVGESMQEKDERNYIQTRQSFKRKWDSFNGEDTSGMELIKEKKVKSDFLVPMSRPRHYREVNCQAMQLDVNNDNVPNVSEEGFKVTSDISSYDPACLCCCLIPGIINTTITKCEAIDSFDGKAMGCSRKVTHFEMLRPSAGIPFKAFCNDHRRKLKDHQCCPGCGLFCAQGNFFECKEENRREVTTGETLYGLKQMTTGRLSSVHRFHKHCQVFSADNKCYCPHCFSESSQVEGVVYNNEPRPATFLIHPNTPKINQISMDNSGSSKSSARFCMPRKDSRNKSGSVCSESLNSIQSSQSGDLKLRNDLDFQGLLESFNGDCTKLKKIRPCPRSLCLACKSGDISKVLYILAEGVDPTIKSDDFSQPAIHLASKYNHKDIVDILLKAGVSPDSIDSELHTPLMVASQNGCLSIVELLLKAGCSVEARAHDGMTALHLAAKSGRKEILRVLLDTRKIDINTQDDGGWTALIWATEHGHKDCIAFLLSMGANPNLKDNELNTALHWGAFTGNEDIIALFLDAGCFIDDVNDHGDTPMHIAARQDHFKCVEVLLWRNADISIANKARLTPLECCVEGKCKSAQHLAFVKRLPNRPKEKIITRDVSRGRESCPIMVVNSVDSEDAQPDFSYILGYVETSPINVNRLVNSLQVCNCTDNCLSSTSCSCCGSSVKRWYDENGRLLSDFNFLEPPLIFECNIMCSCRTTCLNRVVQLGTINNLQVFRTNGRGWGCRTLRDIAKGTFVCEYAGELITDEEANRREDDSYLFDLDFQDSETYCIDAARYGNVSRFINHLCEPNVIPVKVFVDHQDLRFPRICFFASKDIKAFDELGFDYGYKFWSIKWKYFTCTCGSQNCRYSKDTILKTIDEYNKSHMDEVDNE